ncbi:molybdate ABC transporter substrate-binding protein [Sulfitobacter sp. SK011]|uniref:molybdate ABC transporter substrate-binding protein n=1 Tax=Sulfitobacter sp. SK011 TaxID=1389004 RepID=UPI000E0A88D9|nr:molybdate ABC transporter substrate-binding protein [Sulfitobacter sp. SK011]AXI41629.1 molybdate ABC transporter substrate-binding protein [Sulfitobacter sp. SK011]
MRFLTKLLLAFSVMSTGLWAEPAPVTVFAAASLRDALDEVSETYDGPVHLSYGGSGTMARQIAAGAPADVVILAHADWMDWLEENAKLWPGSRHTVATNELVLIGPVGATAAGSDVLALLGPNGRLAMGQRDAVPAGIYAREWLQGTGQWDGIVNRLAETDNVRAALALVARGQAPVGVVYASDVAADGSVVVLASIPANTHSPIIYPAAALTPAGQSFLDHLGTAASKAVFVAHGFGAVPE